jgi:hypothetical protein
MGVFIGGLSRCFGQKWGSGDPLVRPAGQLGWPSGQVCGRTDFGHWIPHALTFLDTLANQNLKRCQHLAGRPHFGSVGPELCAT